MWLFNCLDALRTLLTSGCVLLLGLAVVDCDPADVRSRSPRSSLYLVSVTVFHTICEISEGQNHSHSLARRSRTSRQHLGITHGASSAWSRMGHCGVPHMVQERNPTGYYNAPWIMPCICISSETQQDTTKRRDALAMQWKVTVLQDIILLYDVQYQCNRVTIAQHSRQWSVGSAWIMRWHFCYINTMDDDLFS